jgi:anti-sigma regulatory factor (Ser/Thr protein kinase)
MLIYSDGLVEAHNPAGEIYSLPRLRRLLSENIAAGKTTDWITLVLTSLAYRTGAGWEQEDDVTLLSLERQPTGILGEFEIPAEPGNERLAAEKVLALVQPLNLPPRRLDRLKTAVAEGAMNAMEHGNHYQADLPVEIRVAASATTLTVTIVDQGGGRPIPQMPEPDLEAKLDGLQPPRGWGLFLIRAMVDELHTRSDEVNHTLEMVFYLNPSDPAPAGASPGEQP